MVLSQSRQLEKFWQSGIPFINNYSPGNYHAALQNWGIVQGNDGAIYIANNKGGLRYDGSQWSLIKSPNNLTVRSIAKDTQGKIYVGGNNEIGLLKTDSIKGVYFHSLTDQVNNDSKNFGRVWATHTVGDTVYFVCSHHILKFSTNYFKEFKFSTSESIAFSWVVNDNFYFDVSGKGLMGIAGDKLYMKGESELQSVLLTTILPFNNNTWLISGSTQKIYLFSDEGLKPLIHNNAPVVLAAKPYYGLRLRDGDYAFATLTSGIYIMDENGEVKLHLSKKHGLPSDAIYCMYQDFNGDLWLGTDNGISHISLHSPIRILNEVHGLEGNANDMDFFANSIYVANGKGVYKGIISKGVDAENQIDFSRIPGIDNQTTECLRIGDRLIVANVSGVFSVDRSQVLKKISSDRYVRMEKSFRSNHADFFYGTLENNIGRISFNNQNVESRAIKTINKTPEEFVRTADGNLLINTKTALYEVPFCDAVDQQLDCNNLRQLFVEEYLEDTEKSSVFNLGVNGNNEILLAKGKLFYRFNPSQQLFKIDKNITLYLNNISDGIVDAIIPGAAESFWVKIYNERDDRIRLIKISKEGIIEKPAFNLLSDAVITKIKDTGEGFLMLGSNKGLLLYNENVSCVPVSIQPETHLKISTIKDDVLFIRSQNKSEGNLKLPYIKRDLRFDFSIPAFEMPDQNVFQYKLDGYDENWSGWNRSTGVDYTNLKEGDYVFNVIGKDIYERKFQLSTIKFRILPPWYRSWWAYVCYALSSLMIIYLLIQWRSAELKKEQKRLENIIAERTKHISLQAERLKEMDVIKTRFFANISHEFRTPLTLILAPLENELKKNAETPNKNLLFIKRNADRLLELVNQLLDFMKIESGKMGLELRVDNLHNFLNSVVGSYESLASQKKITYNCYVNLAKAFYKFDHDKIEKICSNLLVNAFKFTPSGGNVYFEAKSVFIGEYEWLSLEVSDTGIGIADGELEKVFQSFYQASNSKLEGGTGLGLSLVKELVNLYQGSIELESDLGKGTSFKVQLPIDSKFFVE